jgi:methyl-accepting chemotaxis protein
MLRLTEKTSILTSTGEGFIDHVVDQMAQIQQTVEKASTSIQILNDHSNEISQILSRLLLGLPNKRIYLP